MLLCKSAGGDDDDDEEGRRQCQSLLPIARVEQLFQYHTLAALQDFYERHHALLHQSVLLLVVPDGAPLVPQPDGTVCVTLVAGLWKSVYHLDTRRYAFISRQDQDTIKSRPREERILFLTRYHTCLFHILQQPQQQTAMVSLKRKRDVALEELQEANTQYRIELALVTHREKELVAQTELERQLLAERHEAEKQRLRDQLLIEFQGQQLYFLMSQQQQQAGTLVVSNGSVGGGGSGGTAMGRAATVNRTVTMNDWLNKNHYAQDLSRLNLVNQTRWFNLFDNGAVQMQSLYNNIIVDTSLGAHRLRLFLPLTYRYSLKRVLLTIEEALKGPQREQIQLLLQVCPDAYTVILYGGANLSELKHRVNCTTLALHCHLILSAHRINAQNFQQSVRYTIVLHDAVTAPHFVPSMELLAAYYPSSVYFGANTYLTHDFTMPILQHRPLEAEKQAAEESLDESDTNGAKRPAKKQKKAKATKAVVGASKESIAKGIGTGHGKCCPYCRFPARTLAQGDVYQESHHPINCPMIALCSQNEAEVLEHIRLRCSASLETRKGKKNKIAKHQFIVGKEAKKVARGDIAFAFDRETVFRHATPDELDSGAHNNGLRLNRPRFVEMRRDIDQTLKKQLDGPLFGELHPTVARLMSLFQDMETGVPLRALLYDEFGEKFIATRYNAETKKPLRTFENDDGLYFSLDSSLPRPQLFVTVNKARLSPFDFYCAEYQTEVLQQRCFLEPYVI